MTQFDPASGTKITRVSLLLIDEFALMSYASVTEPLRAANLIAGQVLYELRNFAAAGEVARCSNGLKIPSDGDILAPPQPDIVFVLAGGPQQGILQAPVGPLLRKLDQRGVTLGGISGGPLVLAQAGVMQGRRMTVHWEHAPALTEIAPDLLLEKSLYVIDRNRITCAGGIAPLDLMHSLIARTHGRTLAREVSDWFLHTDIRPSAGAQRAGLAEQYGTTNRAVLDTIALMKSHIADPLPLDRLATLARLSPRQLSRLFREALGQTPMAFYRDLRLSLSRNLLRNSALSITEIALATGFSSAAHFATAFRSRYGTAPSAAPR